MDYYSPPRMALRQLRSVLYPRRCPFCDQVLGSEMHCPDCAEALEELRRKPDMRLDMDEHYFGSLTGAAAPYRYEGMVRRAILRAKYQGAPWTAAELGVQLAELAFGSEIRMWGAEPVPQRPERANRQYSCVAPVPASGSARGYNVPELLAAPVARALGIPMIPDALCCVHKAERQAGLPWLMRIANVAGAFQVRDPELVAGRNILLVDDIITTGATAAACTQALLDAGADGVFAVAFATAELETPRDKMSQTEDEAEDELDF